MSLVTRTATIQVRVVPVVKRASEEVLWRIGLTMSQAIELFLRRVIVDERIPFDLIALETAQIDMVPESSLTGERTTVGEDGEEDGARVGRLRSRSNPRAARKKFKKFLGAHTSGKIQVPKDRKIRLNEVFWGTQEKYGFTPPYGCCNSREHPPILGGTDISAQQSAIVYAAQL